MSEKKKEHTVCYYSYEILSNADGWLPAQGWREKEEARRITKVDEKASKTRQIPSFFDCGDCFPNI